MMGSDKNDRYEFDHLFNRNRKVRWDTRPESKRSDDGSSSRPSPQLIDFKGIFSVARRRIWSILFCVVLFTGAAYYMGYHYMMPVYRSASTVELVQDRERFTGGDDAISRIIRGSLEGGAMIRTPEGEIYNFRSTEVIGTVARQLAEIKYQPDGEIYPILMEEYPEDTTTVDLSTMVSRIRETVSIEPLERGSSFLEVSMTSHSPYEASRLTNMIVNRYLEWSNEKKRSSVSSARAFLESEKERVESALQRAENRLGSFMNQQELVELETQASTGVDALASLESEQISLEIELESVRAAISTYETRLESIRPGLVERFSEALGPTINRYQQELAELTTRRFVILSNNPGLEENQQSEPELRRLNNQIEELREEIKTLSSKMLSQSDEFLGFEGGGDMNLTTEISNLQNQLMELRLQRNQLESQLSAIRNRIEDTRMFLDRVPENRIQLARLQREVEVYTDLFKILSNQAAEVSVMEQTIGEIGNVVLSAEVPDYPVSPPKELMILAGILLGVVLPVGLIYFRENLDTKIQSVKDLESYNYPVLSVIYDFNKSAGKRGSAPQKAEEMNGKKHPAHLLISTDSASPLAESYRRLVNNVMFSFTDKSPRTFVVTSSAQGEGKTTIVGNMGAAFAELGLNVLAIDADLRSPDLGRFFGEKNSPGLQEMLFDGKKGHQVIRSSSVKNLYLLTAGKQSMSPPFVLGSDKLKKLLKNARSYFDIILMDTAPMGIITDSAPLLDLADGLIMVSRMGKTQKSDMRHTLQQIERSDAHVLGTVLNGFNPGKSHDSTETNMHYQNLYKNYYEYTRS